MRFCVHSTIIGRFFRTGSARSPGRGRCERVDSAIRDPRGSPRAAAPLYDTFLRPFSRRCISAVTAKCQRDGRADSSGCIPQASPRTADSLCTASPS
ncbi:hypothetical protein DBV15_00611 [Temnothorax longispinosus]|uniref:Uncharacterized protein n=1 Tax=Temnothorax longispinosus TaxID=300112 RepID=A0A4S2KSS6_9HYME|nr:hypothetical protein DBV15_00611 [Temnothorax longispinosus]